MPRLPKLHDEVGRVVSLVGSDSDASAADAAADHLDRRQLLGPVQFAVHLQAAAVLHQRIAHETQPDFFNYHPSNDRPSSMHLVRTYG